MSHLRPLKHPFYKRKIKMIPGHARDRFAACATKKCSNFFLQKTASRSDAWFGSYRVRKWRNFGARKNRLTKFSQFTAPYFPNHLENWEQKKRKKLVICILRKLCKIRPTLLRGLILHFAGSHLAGSRLRKMRPHKMQY